MDAPTTTSSADNGESGGSSGDWGWFTPSRKPQENDPGTAERDTPEQDAGDQREPGRPVSPIRPVGTGADRRAATEPPPAQARTAAHAPAETERSRPEPPPRRPTAPHPQETQRAEPQRPEAPRPEPQRPEARRPEPRRSEARRSEGGRPDVARPEAARTRTAEPPAAAAPPDTAGRRSVPAQRDHRWPESGDGESHPADREARDSAPRHERTAIPQPEQTAIPRPEQVPQPRHEQTVTPPPVPSPTVTPPTAAAATAAAPAPEPVALPEPAPDEDASPDAILIRRSLAEIEPVADKVTSYFYALLFVQHPQLRELFPAAMDAQRDRLFRALLMAAKLIDDPEILTEYLSRLGRGHRKYGTVPDHYPAVGECLLGALTRYAPKTWDDETESAWVRAYTAISQIMIDSAAEDEQHAPPWWHAEVVSHELRTSDIAVITLRPDQPYPFLAGQFTSVETPWWPRVWRHYSFASAPRSDGLLTLHVKAVPAGWVSTALVRRARPGDVIRLGSPGGSMTIDHSTDNGLLCLGGGTGIAPIKALVEDVAEHGQRRPVDVFYGARSDHDLYDLETMLRLESRLPWLSVRSVVSDGPSQGLTGQLPEAVRRYGPWSRYDAYLSGPAGMIRSGVDTLRDIGIPSHRIRHDSIEELAAAAAVGE